MKGLKTTGHKNFELLRFYLSKDINKIHKKINNKDNQILGYTVASLVDILIVIIFNDSLNELSLMKKIICIMGLIGIFLLLQKLIFRFTEWREEKNKETGNTDYLTENILQKIDDFDNIACDGLLICEMYINEYQNTKERYIKEFYLYEIIHYLKKITDVYRGINENQALYINNLNKELLDSYRIKNFIIFTKKTLGFLNKHLKDIDQEGDLYTDLVNLNSEIEKWEYLPTPVR